MGNAKRVDWIDCAKGILICLVVVGHIISDSSIPFQNWIYSFHIPAFFILEGVTMDVTEVFKKRFGEFTKRNFYGLLYPYFVFSILFLLRSFMQYLIGTLSLMQLVNYFFMLISFCGIGVLWFLPTLFLSKLLFYITFKKRRYALFTFILIVSLLICVFATSMLNSDSNIFSLVSVIILIFRVVLATGFISIGYVISIICRKFMMDRNIKFLIYILCMVISIMFYQFNGIVDFHIIQIHNPIGYFIFALSGGFLIFGLAKIFEKSKVLLFWGRNSIIIMLTHTILGVYKIALILSEKVLAFYNVRIILAFIVTMILESLLIFIITKKVKWLIKPTFV